MAKWWSSIAVTVMVACAGDPGGQASPDVATQDDTPVDGAGADTASPPDAPDSHAPDVDSAPDGEEDIGETPDPCAFPAPRLGDAGATLATDASACGQTPFAWLPMDDMGEVLMIEEAGSIPAALLEAVASTQSSALPRTPEHDVLLTRVLYRTQDRGEPVEATTLVARPANAPAGPQDVLLVLHGTIGFTDQCAPSNKPEGAALAALFASWGYLVVAPDFIGLKSLGEPTGYLHPYLIGQPTAISSLDAVRAAGRLHADTLGGVCATPRVLVFGASQGGHAALWVDRLQPYYAGELDLLGVVATTPPADMVGQTQRALTDIVSATGNTIAVLGAGGPWYGLDLSEVFKAPYDTEIPELLASKCSPSKPKGITGLDDLFQPGLLEAAASQSFADHAGWGCMIRENGLVGTSVTRANPDRESYGVMVVTSEADNLVHTPIERDAVNTLCAQGMPLVHLDCAGAGHVEGSFWALGETLSFLEARQAGEPFTAPCEATEPVQCSGAPTD